MKITGHIPKCAAGQGIAEEETLNSGMEEESDAFVEKGAEVYAEL